MGNSERSAHLPHTGDPLNKVFSISMVFVKYFIHEQDPVGSMTHAFLMG